MKTMLITLALTAGTLVLSALPAQAHGRDDRGWRHRDRAPARVVFVEPRHRRHHREVVVCRPRYFMSGPFVIQSSWFTFGSREQICYVTGRR